MNGTGLVLVLGSIGIFVLDLKATSHGVLSAAALAVFIVGSLLLFSPVQGLGLPVLGNEYTIGASPALILLVGGGLTAFFALAVPATLRARHRPAMAIGPIAVGVGGVAATDLAPMGVVRVRGEEWNASAIGEPIQRGEAVQVVERSGLRLTVRRATPKQH